MCAVAHITLREKTMEIKIRSKKDDVTRLSDKLVTLSEILTNNNLLPLNVLVENYDKEYSVSVEVDKISFANMFSQQTHELTESNDTLIVSVTSSNGIRFYCKQSKKPRYVRLSAQEITNESWSY